MPYTISGSKIEAQATATLQAMPKRLPARYTPSNLDGAVKSAARSAEQSGKPWFVYSSNSYGHFVWRVTWKRADALCFVNNSGGRLYEVTPSREITRHTLTR